MRFAISRTSGWDKKPCKEAYRDTYTRVDIRTVDDPSKIPANKGESTDWWYAAGENHRVVKGQITRDFPGEKGWFIDISSLDELMALRSKYGSLIIGWLYSNADIPSIEIYDDYRE